MKATSLLRKPFKYEFRSMYLVLACINIAVFLLGSAAVQTNRYLALNPLLVVRQGMFWQVFTYMFVHGSLGHLASNMIGLVFFGSAVERRMGSSEFLLFYLLSGMLSGAISLGVYLLTSTYYVFLMGASGAVFAVLLAYAVLYPSSVIYLWAVVPIPAPLLVVGYAGYEAFNLFAGSRSGIAHGTHLSGFFVAWLYFIVRFGIDPLKVWRRL